MVGIQRFIGVWLAMSLMLWATAAGAQGTDRDAAGVRGDDKPWNKGVPFAQRSEGREIFLEANKLAKSKLFATAAATYREALIAMSGRRGPVALTLPMDVLSTPAHRTEISLASTVSMAIPSQAMLTCIRALESSNSGVIDDGLVDELLKLEQMAFEL